jgi:hypothetical protein
MSPSRRTAYAASLLVITSPTHLNHCNDPIASIEPLLEPLLCCCHQQFTGIIPSVVSKRISATLRKRPGKPRRGRPIVHSDEWSKVSVVLFNRQIVRLDAAVQVMRRKTGRPLNRAAIIRALIDGVLDSGFELTTITSESDLRQRLAKLLRR